MTAIIILAGAALGCAIGVAGFTALGIRFRSEAFGFYLFLAAFMCAMGAFACVSSAVTRADAFDKQRLETPEK